MVNLSSPTSCKLSLSHPSNLVFTSNQSTVADSLLTDAAKTHKIVSIAATPLVR